MTKVLLSTIGDPQYTFSKDRKGNESIEKSYQPTEYYYGSQSFRSRYTFDALNGMLRFDQIILLGTAGSGWQELYEYIFDEKNGFSALKAGAEFDPDYYDSLVELYSDPEAYKQPAANVKERLETLKNCIEGCREIIILQPGKNDEEWDANLYELQNLKDSLPNDASLSIDLTFGFRTLPIYEVLSVQYLQNITGNQVRIDLLTYALKEKNTDTMHFINLSPMTDLLEYTRVIHEYNRYGTIHSIDTVSNQSDVDALSRKAKQIMKQLSDIISFNDISGFRSVIEKCHDLAAQVRESSAPPEMRLLSEHIFQDLDNRFWPTMKDEYLFQYELALWHFEKKRYLVAATTAEECTITFAAELLGRKNCSYKIRSGISGQLSYTKSTGGITEVKDFKTVYDKLRNDRNELAHPDGSYQDNRELARNLLDNLTKIKEIYLSSFSDPVTCAANRETLKDTIDLRHLIEEK